jgi:hypothetical protein
LLNRWQCASLIFSLLICSASVVCGKQASVANNKDVLVLQQNTAELGKVELFCNEQHLRVHPFKRYWTAIASGPDIVVYRDDRREICKTDAKSVLSFLNRAHLVGNMELPPLKSVKKVMDGLAVTKSDYCNDGTKGGFSYVCYVTAPNGNADFSKFLDALYAIPERPGVPISFLHSGSKRDAKFFDQLMYFESKVEVTKYADLVLSTTSWKRIADDSNLWKAPSNYRQVKQVGEIILQGDWKAVLDDYSDYSKRDINVK